MGNVTIEIDAKDALVLHIESLQRSLTKRNETIARLEARLDAGEESPLIREAYERGIKEGWAACSHELMNGVDSAVRALSGARKEGFDAFLKGDRLARERRQASSDAGGAE